MEATRNVHGVLGVNVPNPKSHTFTPPETPACPYPERSKVCFETTDPYIFETLGSSDL
jgi:hypothetical protein